MTDSSLFEGTTPAEPLDKYSTWEPDALRNKAIAADNHIKTLEEENRNLREQTKQTATLQEVLEKLDRVNPSSPSYTPPAVNPTPVQPNTSQQVTKEDITNLVTSTFEQEQKKNQAKQNVATVKAELQKVWGDNFPQRLSEKSKEIGASENFLANMAENYPQAFLKLVLADTKPAPVNPNVHVPPGTTPNKAAPMTGETYKDFRAQEKLNPKLLSDPIFQQRKHEAAQRLGDSFFN